jgi:hypothetical protein
VLPKRDTTDAETKKEKVFTVSAEKIDEVEVHAASGDVTSLKRSGTDWQIVAPAGIDADENAAGTLVTSLESIDRQKVLDENPASVKAFGLDPARFSITFKVTGDATPHRLRLLRDIDHTASAFTHALQELIATQCLAHGFIGCICKIELDRGAGSLGLCWHKIVRLLVCGEQGIEALA